MEQEEKCKSCRQEIAQFKGFCRDCFDYIVGDDYDLSLKRRK